MVGDGTSTPTIPAHAILADGVRDVVAGASAIDIKRGLDRAAGVAVIRVGAPSESEMKSRKDALDDAINATKAAVSESLGSADEPGER